MPNTYLSQWADSESIYPAIIATQKITQPNPTITISEFHNRTKRAKLKNWYVANVYRDHRNDVPFLDAIDAIQQLQILEAAKPKTNPKAKKTDYYFSFAEWNGTHDQQGFVSQTSLNIEYQDKYYYDVAEIIKAELGIAFFTVPTVSTYDGYNCHSFVFPMKTATDWKETYRLGSLIAHCIGKPGITPNCITGTYLHKLRTDQSPKFVDGSILDPVHVMENGRSLYTQIAKLER